MSSYQSPWMNEQLRLFRATLRKFITNEFVLQQARWCRLQSSDAAAWPAAGAMGMLLPDVPETYGGDGVSFAYECVVIEELAQAGVNFGTASQSIVARYLLAYGNEEQKRRWLPTRASGEMADAIVRSDYYAPS